MKAAKLKQEEEDAILAANSFALRDEDDPMGAAAEEEEEEGEEGEEVEVMDLAGLEGGSSDLDEEMVEAAIVSRLYARCCGRFWKPQASRGGE